MDCKCHPRGNGFALVLFGGNALKVLRLQILHLAAAVVAVLTVTLCRSGAWSQTSRTITAPSAQPEQQLTRSDAVAATPRIKIDSPSLQGSIALKGGRIDDLVLTKYRETADPKSPNVVLFSPLGAPHPYYAEYGWVAGSGATQLTRYALARGE
jgi:YidC/Oxa1 family membrane protein insertase